MSNPTFTGSAEQQALAEEVFRVMKAQGALFALDAPIRQTLDNLATFFANRRKKDAAAVATEIDAALRENSAVFVREEQGNAVTYITSKQGGYQPRNDGQTHMFSRRLFEPENPLPTDDISVVVTTTRPALTTVEPVFISDYWQRQAGLLPDERAEGEDETEVAVAAEPVLTAEEPAQAAVAAEEAEEEETFEPVTALPPSSVIALPNGLQIDLKRPVADLMAQYGNTLVSQFRNAVENDALRRIVLFGNDTYPEAMVSNFGKNDMRRIRDYILETGEPMLDTQIISDIFYHNTRQPDYEAFRFALNYRLSREKDFEFTGVDGARTWSTKGLPAIGTKRVKASEMGQMAGYLEEGFDDSLAAQSADSIRQSGTLSHVLTFFEWEYGLMPFTKALATLLPGPLLSDQRTATLRFESPQHYTTILTELRYPTGNRGGWLSGFEAFFHEHLVPGALVTLARTDDANVFTLTYEEQPETSDRLLVLDEKKNKFAFANVEYYCAVDSDLLLAQQRWGRLRNLKSLPMNERRKSDVVLEHVFETVGEPVGTRSEPQYLSTEDDLTVALNVLRPGSKTYVQHLLRDGELFKPDDKTPGAWYYEPPPAEVSDDDDDDDYDDDYDD